MPDSIAHANVPASQTAVTWPEQATDTVCDTAPPSAPASAPTLFRPEALTARQTHWLGTVVVEPSRAHRYFTLFAALTAVAILGLFGFCDFTSTARVTGWLVPDQGLVRVFAPQAGVITRLQVKEGTLVRQGEPLLTLSAELTSASLGATQAEVARLLAARRQLLLDQRAVHQRQLAQQQRSLESRLAAFRSEQAQIEQEIALQKSRLELAQRTEERQRELRKRGFISEQQLQQAEEARLTQATRLAGIQRDRIALARDHLALQSELNELPLKAQTELANLERDIAAIEQQLAEAEARREIAIVAPQAGRVTAILAETGGHANPANPLLTIVPAGASLEAHLYGPSRTIGFVHPGQPVLLRYQAYPYQKFGHYDGIVDSVSTSAIHPSELPPAAGVPLAGSEPVYRITVHLARQTVTAYGKSLPLQPGMQLEADLALDKRRLYEWVLDPLYTLVGK